jgi:hypothetical protein
MEKSLKQMAERIDLVANERPMEVRIPPVSVANVEKWASQFLTMFPSTAAAETPATTIAPSKTSTKPR